MLVVLIRASDFASGARNRKIYVTMADPGGLSSRADALDWYKQNFEPLTGDDLLNVCYPRQLKHDD